MRNVERDWVTSNPLGQRLADKIDEIINGGVNVITGPVGPIGPQGPQGAIGLTGINYKGGWVSGTAYIATDVVNSPTSGNAYYCKVGLTSIVDPGTLTMPTVNWGIFVMQGADGIQGIKGEQGIQGEAGTGEQGIAGVPGDQGIQGLQGEQGIQGIQGIQGETGLLGLTYRGDWVETDEYLETDVVRSTVDGNAYYCKVANTGTEPSTNTTEWSLFVMKGATGEQGIQGEQGGLGEQGVAGEQGIPGVSATIKTKGYATGNTLALASTLDYDIVVINSFVTGNFVKLPIVTSDDIGKEIIVEINQYPIKIHGNDRYISIFEPSGASEQVDALANTRYRFTFSGMDWFVEAIDANKLIVNGLLYPKNNVVLSLVNTTTEIIDVATLNSAYSFAVYPVGFSLICPIIGVIYTRYKADGWVQVNCVDMNAL